MIQRFLFAMDEPAGEPPKAAKGGVQLKCLTVRQPWAHAIIFRGKTVENRSWPSKYRGPLLIHAGVSRQELVDRRGSDMGWTPEGYFPDSTPFPRMEEMAFGAVIGQVLLKDVLPYGHELLLGNEWADGEWCWLLEDPRPLKTPIMVKGGLGLWTYKGGIKLEFVA